MNKYWKGVEQLLNAYFLRAPFDARVGVRKGSGGLHTKEPVHSMTVPLFNHRRAREDEAIDIEVFKAGIEIEREQEGNFGSWG